jgi:hypothetical protein
MGYLNIGDIIDAYRQILDIVPSIVEGARPSDVIAEMIRRGEYVGIPGPPFYCKSTALNEHLSVLRHIIEQAFSSPPEKQKAKEAILGLLISTLRSWDLAEERHKQAIRETVLEDELKRIQDVLEQLLERLPQHSIDTGVVSPSTTIPLLADGLPTDGLGSLARFVYFTIVTDDPSPGWFLTLMDRSVPFVLFGMAGLVIQPSPTEIEFTSPQQIQALIDVIEGIGEGGLSVESGIIWLPLGTVQRAFTHDAEFVEWSLVRPNRGDVFRVSLRIFREAWRMYDGSIDANEMSLRCEEIERTSTVPPAAQPPSLIAGRWPPVVPSTSLYRTSQSHVGTG